MTTGRPRVHWASPLPPAQTDIAHYTTRILPDLAEEADLTLWTVQEEWDPALERHAPVRRIDPFAATPADFAGDRTSTAPDALFVHLGNDWVFHAGLLMLARRIPSIPVVHDLALQELLHGAVHHGYMHRAAYADGMTRWYSADLAEQGLRMIDDAVEPNTVAGAAPGFEIAMENAIAALVHSRPAFERIAARRALPAYRLDLPYRAAPPPERAARAGPLRLVQFGFLGMNRRVLQVIEALGDVAAEIDFTFDILGRVWDADAVARKAAEAGIADRVVIHGFVPETTLDAHLAAADLVFNLRHPTMGEASGSQLRIWNAAAGSVVTDAGWYADLPDACVFKVSVAGERAELADLMRRIQADRSLPAARGVAGRARLLERHDPRDYARRIAAVARRAPQDARLALLSRAALPALAASRERAFLARAVADAVEG